MLNTCSAADNKAQLDAIDALLTETEEKEHTRIAATVDAGLPTPRTMTSTSFWDHRRARLPTPA